MAGQYIGDEQMDGRIEDTHWSWSVPYFVYCYLWRSHGKGFLVLQLYLGRYNIVSNLVNLPQY